jgi:galactokinase
VRRLIGVNASPRIGLLNDSRTIADLAAEAAAAFRLKFNQEPRAIGVAPGRVNLIGEHVDYEGGLVLPMAIDRWLVVALGTHDEDVMRGASVQMDSAAGTVTEWGPGNDSCATGWLKYVAGVWHGYRERGWAPRGINLAVVSSLPPGAGLSSSAALETATAVAMESAGAPALSADERAMLCLKAEHDFAGVPCGAMDQLVVGKAEAGRALLIDCRSLETQSVPLPDGIGVLVVNTGVRHELAASEYPKRRAECREAAALLGVEMLREATLNSPAKTLLGAGHATLRNRAEHVVREIERTRAFADAMAASDLAAAGELMRASHDSLRDLFEVSCAELDTLVTVGRGMPEVLGCRMTGGGFGGSAVFLVEESSIEAVARDIQSRYRAEIGLEAEALLVSPVGAAQALDLSIIHDQPAPAAAF